MGKLFTYDSGTNKVNPVSDIPYERFRTATNANSYFVRDRADGKVEVYSLKGDMVIIRGVTVEQAIILFAMMLGMREEAAGE